MILNILETDTKTLMNNLQTKAIRTNDAVISPVDGVREGNLGMDKTYDALEKLADSIEKIAESIEEITRNVLDMASSSEEQAASVEEITVSVNEVSVKIQGTSREAADAAAPTEKASASID